MSNKTRSRIRPWDTEEIEWLRKNWKHYDTELCEHLNRSLWSIRDKRKKLGLINKPNQRKSSWSQEDIDYIAEVWGQKTIPEIANKLGRSINAVKVKAVRLGYTGQKWCGEMMSARKVSELLGVDVHAITDRWIPKYGLRGKQKRLGERGYCTIIYFEDLLIWLKKNQDKWDSRRVELYGLGAEYDWLVAKRKIDASIPARHAQKWKPDEDFELRRLYKANRYTYQQIGERLNRSRSAVANRLKRLDVWGTGKYIGDRTREIRDSSAITEGEAING